MRFFGILIGCPQNDNFALPSSLLNDAGDARALQRSVSVHGEFRAFDYGGGYSQRQGQAFFTGYSAGSHPSGVVRPEALKLVEMAHLPTGGLRSKSWEEFAKPGAPQMNFVFTVCDNAAQETCPIWPGQPMTAHWGVPDPAALKGTPEQIEHAFRDAYLQLERRISLFLSLPLASLDKLAIQREVDHIGHQ